MKEAFDNTESDEETEQIFKKLRPQSPYKFKDLIKGSFDPLQFARQQGDTQQKMSKAQVKDLILYNKPVHKAGKRTFQSEDFAELQSNMRLMHNFVQFGD